MDLKRKICWQRSVVFNHNSACQTSASPPVARDSSRRGKLEYSGRGAGLAGVPPTALTDEFFSSQLGNICSSTFALRLWSQLWDEAETTDGTKGYQVHWQSLERASRLPKKTLTNTIIAFNRYTRWQLYQEGQKCTDRWIWNSYFALIKHLLRRRRQRHENKALKRTN